MSSIQPNKHRSEMLDKLLGKRVAILWKDNASDGRGVPSEGVLHWGNDFGPSVKKNMYYLSQGSIGISFYKSHIRAIVPLTRGTSGVSL